MNYLFFLSVGSAGGGCGVPRIAVMGSRAEFFRVNSVREALSISAIAVLSFTADDDDARPAPSIFPEEMPLRDTVRLESLSNSS